MPHKDHNIAQVLEAIAATKPQATALVVKEGRRWQHYSFNRLATQCDQFATSLHKEGISKGSRVILMARPSFYFVALTFALFRLGAIVILIDPGMGYRNLLRCIASVQPEVLIGIRRAIFLSQLFPKAFTSLRKRLCVHGFFPGSTNLNTLLRSNEKPPVFVANEHERAAILFTTGSTGPPKGVCYTHGIFHAQLELIRDYYGIGEGDTDQPGFPLFGLFSTALGIKAVLPEMNPAHPARVNPGKFVASLQREKVSYSFGSPAIWNVVSRYCLNQKIILPLTKVLMAGAPVSGELLARMQKVLPKSAQIFTPYGATESLPVSSIEAREVVEETWEKTKVGKGVCVGRPLPGMEIYIIEPCDNPIESWSSASILPTGTVGEIVARGPVVTPGYDHNDKETSQAKIQDGNGILHRMGDMGYLDAQGRLWFCGRKAHRVLAQEGPMYSVCCEAIFNEHPLVRRSALVGVGRAGSQIPVIVVEPQGRIANRKLFSQELAQLAQANPLTQGIKDFLIHTSFPVDIRHNAKIFREQLATWATGKLSSH